MRGLDRAVALLLDEGGLVDQEVGVVRGDRQRRGRRRVAGDHQLAARAGGPHDLLGRDSVDALPALQAPEVGTGAHAQALGQRGVEAAGTLLLEQRVAQGRDPVLDREGRHPVAVALDGVAGRQLVDLERIGDAAHHRAQQPHQLPQPGRAVDRQRHLAQGT